MEILLSALVSGLMLGLVLAIMALGLTIIFGVMDMVNFAHGEFLMIGMYAGLLTAQFTGADPLFGLPLAAAAGFLLGVLCYYGLAKYLLRGPMLAQLLGTFGLMLFLRNLALLVMGSEDRALHQGLLVGKSLEIGLGIIIPATKLAAAVFGITAFISVWLLMNKTKVGQALTATSLNAEGARYMGIQTEKINALAWGLGGATATLSGALLVNFWSVNPFVGLLFTMIAFTVVALGGFGSVPGAFFAGLVVGVIMELPGIWDFFTYTFHWSWMEKVPMTSFKYTFVYLAYFLIMVFRPRGLFGWKQ